jgi:hypothetical protein
MTVFDQERRLMPLARVLLRLGALLLVASIVFGCSDKNHNVVVEVANSTDASAEFKRLTSGMPVTSFVVFEVRTDRRIEVRIGAGYWTTNPGVFCGLLNENADFSPLERSLEFRLVEASNSIRVVVPLDYRNPDDFKANHCAWSFEGIGITFRERFTDKLLGSLAFVDAARPDAAKRGYAPQSRRDVFDVVCSMASMLRLRSCSYGLDTQHGGGYFPLPREYVQRVSGDQMINMAGAPHLKINVQVANSSQ